MTERAVVAPAKIHERQQKLWKLSKVLGAGFFISCVLPLSYYGEKYREITAKAPNFNADAIVVLTGARGRIKFALDHLKPKQRLLISGVADGWNDQKICEYDGIDARVMAAKRAQIDIRYEAQDTYGNAIETKQYLQDHKNIRSILVISDAPYLPRAAKEMEQCLGDAWNVTYTSPGTLSVSCKMFEEAYKVLWRVAGLPTMKRDLLAANHPRLP